MKPRQNISRPDVDNLPVPRPGCRLHRALTNEPRPPDVRHTPPAAALIRRQQAGKINEEGPPDNLVGRHRADVIIPAIQPRAQVRTDFAGGPSASVVAVRAVVAKYEIVGRAKCKGQVRLGPQRSRRKIVYISVDPQAAKRAAVARRDHPQADGVQWMVVTTVVDDSRYLQQPFIISSHFKKEPDASKWDPTPCSATW